MSKLALLSGLFLVAAAAGCGDDDGGGGQTIDGGGDLVDAPPGAADANDTDAFVAPPGSFTVEWGPVNVPAGGENTQCVTKRLGNPGAIHVNQIHNQLNGVSHHLIVYQVADTTEVTTPVDCQPFTDTLNPANGSPLMITQKHDEVLQLPDGIGFALAANQMIRLEMHFVNATENPMDVGATSTFVPMPEAEFQQEAGFVFIGDPDIDIAPNSMETLGPVFIKLPADYNGVTFFALTGHEHQFGTNVLISTAANAGDTGTPVYDIPNWSWSEPETAYFDPGFQLPANGGFRFQCDWNNTSNQQVGFGESATDEMCFFWAYYYPNKGAKVCVHTTMQVGPPGVDLCCPGNALCQFLPF